MRARLLGIVISLVVVVVFGLGVPLSIAIASSESEQMFLDRLNDTDRFTSLAQRPLIDGMPGTLVDTLVRYQQVYGVQASVIDLTGHQVYGSRATIDLADPVIGNAVDAALAGVSPRSGPTVWPWSTDPMVVAEPILVDGEQRGVAVTVSSTAHVRSQIIRAWVVVGLGALVAIVLAVLAALPIVRWVLRPVRRLDDATAELADAVGRGQTVHPVGGSAGPPELRRLSRSFDRMAGTVSDALAAQRAFIADASHQLRNPLTALRLRLGNLEGRLPESAIPQHEAAVTEAERMGHILDELLAMAKAESWSVDPVEVDVDQVVLSCAAEWQAVGARRDIALVLAGERGGRALAPPGGLEVVLDALLDNAVKFTGEGTLVEVEVRRADGRVRLWVRDHGPGLAPDELERATDRFWRSAAHTNIRGTGLGLAIVSRLVARVGGTVTLDLPDGGGLRVGFDLPAVPDPQPPSD